MIHQFVHVEKPLLKILKCAQVSSSTYYQTLKGKGTLDGRKSNLGRPLPGYSLNTKGEAITDVEILKALKNFRFKKEFENAGGYQKLKYYLYREHELIINKKKVYRLCKESGILLKRIKKPKRGNNTQIARNRKIYKENQLWELDVKYGYIHGENRFFYLLAIIDVYTWFIVGYYIGLSCKGKDLVFTVDAAIKSQNLNSCEELTIRSDNGPQMLSKIMIDYIKTNASKTLIHELIPVGMPNKNAHIESFNSIFEIEFLQTRYFKTYAEAYEQTVEFINFYNKERIHGSLKYRTPIEVCELLKKGEPQNIKTVNV